MEERGGERSSPSRRILPAVSFQHDDKSPVSKDRYHRGKAHQSLTSLRQVGGGLTPCCVGGIWGPHVITHLGEEGGGEGPQGAGGRVKRERTWD
ncbi:hypothetical protein DPEC_G00338910 [Dallia pectoralis]|uniref:Uncharacterized protein n=1 Tax=Dallia pectoralis TaxID=75939 RepID=A0ACC2F532_DALPE|nr:hypothetical protein DPEC_G00338910 [Dallia pectoralis]